MANTPNLNLTQPTVGGSSGTWGTSLNDNMSILDGLAVTQVINVSANYSAVVGTFPETILRVTTGTATIAVTLPSPSSSKGRIFLVKKIDAGIGTITVTPSSGTIDGQASWQITNQYDYVRFLSNGTGYDVV